ncbi:MAG: penicillin acylase family protein [Alphaproteobacteria bacterium]|nr:penicillin acylase family protein [Alphaproteobacteria bacterium]
MLRGLAIVLALIAVATASALGGFYLYLRSGLPLVAGEIALAGLAAPVTVGRDPVGVPYIAARSEADAWYALGFVHAQDRLWQMDFQRRIGAGRLSEIMGPATIGFDRFMRTLGLYRVAEANLAHLSPPVRAALDAYAAGVNAFLATRHGALPPEFLLLRYAPEPWTPADSLVWGRMLALQLSDNMRHELLRARLARRLPPKQLADLYPNTTRREAPVTLAGALADDLWAALPHEVLGVGASNEWVLAGQHSAGGKPILANDPHLRFGMPNLWYLARLEAPGLALTGATIPGVPFFVLGHNGRVAWGMTTTHSDTQDVFVERLDPGDPERYLVPAGSAAFAARAETILVRGGEPVELVVRETRHGPVVTDVLGGAREVAGGGGQQVLALAFTGLAPDDRTAEALYRLNRAQDWESFLAALADFHSPQQNVAYADTAGNIGFAVAGRTPVRRHGDGRLPAPGWSGEYDWTGWLPAEALPRAFNPPGGIVVNANNKPGPDSTTAPLGSDWDHTYRARRILDLLSVEPRQSVESAAAMQMDAVSLAARDLLPFLVQVEPHDDRGRRAILLLKSWDGRMDRRRAEPLIFAAWLRELNRLLYADELGPLFPDYWGFRPDVVELMLTQRREWCDDVTTPARETCEERIATALDRALAWIQRHHGRSPGEWRWGDAHQATFSHPVLGKLWLVRRWSDLVLPSDGDAFTINRGLGAIGDDDEPFAHLHGASFRAVYDLADLDNSRFMQPTGQSGHPLSSHYSDLGRRWRDGRTVRIPAQYQPGPREKASVLTLKPAP